jgi:hypothetical protein
MKIVNREQNPLFVFVTASLHVGYLCLPPLGMELELMGKVIELKGRKVVSEITVPANGEIAKGKVVIVQNAGEFY